MDGIHGNTNLYQNRFINITTQNNKTMCEYCEKDNNDMVKLLFDQDKFMGCIGKISPIAKRRYPEMSGELHIRFDVNGSTSVPINFCPICGRKL